MRRVVRSLCLALLAAAPLAVGAQPANLVDIYLVALESNANFRAARAQYEASRQEMPIARSRILPSLAAQASRTESDTEIDRSGSPTINRDFPTTSYSLNLSQVLYNRAFFAQLGQARSQVAQATAEFAFAHQELILLAAGAYFDVLAAEDNLQFAQAETKAISQQLEQARQRFEVGLTAITDVREAQARYDQALAQEIAADNQLAVSREVLREVTGQAFEDLAGLQRDLPLLRPDPEDLDAWVSRALEQNFQLIASRHGADVAQDQITVARSARYPSLNIVASHGYTDTESFTSGFTGPLESTETTIGLQLQMQLYEGGAIGARTDQAGFLFQQATEVVELQRRATERQTRSAYLTVLADISSVNALERALESAITALDATQAGFEVGTRTAVEVLNSQQQVFLARRDLARARYDYILDTLRLKQAAGTLSEEDVVLVNRWLTGNGATQAGQPSQS